MIHLGFLWHMHQPLYVDPTSGEALLPWVRLHATRAYYDMAMLALDYPEVHQTINLVPVLVSQLERLVAGGTDRYRRLSEAPADGLSEEDARFLIEMFFQANWHTLVLPNPGYRRLLEMRGGEHIHAEAVSRFTTQDLRDLQVWFNLAWFGFTARRNFPLLQELLTQQQGFSEAQKRALLQIQDEVVGQILPLYRQAQQTGCIELSTTPFYHPILPLLCSTDSARQALPHANLPSPSFRYPQDARAQIDRALSYFERTFGIRPRGMWPSEGSVSPEVVSLMEEAGLSWFATSEGILQLSQLNESAPPHWRDGNDRPSVVQPYRVGNISGFFRQLELSDRIGFTYSHMQGPHAAEDLLGRVRHVVENARATVGNPIQPMVPIILDGENPWEHYPDGGESFLRGLYAGILAAPDLSAITFSEYLERHEAASEIERLWSGSWIYSNFQIWIGHPEDVAAWDRLRETRETLEAELKQAEEKALNAPSAPESGEGSLAAPPDEGAPDFEAAWESLYAAEGSDWFWWFGDEFSSAAESEFDRLFRTHLKNVYQALRLNPPGNLEIPIKGMRRFQPLPPPRGIIRPTIDGHHSTWWEWEEAGSTPLQATGGAMARGTRLLSALSYGYDQEHVFLKIDYGPDLFLHGDEPPALELLLISPASLLLKTRLLHPKRHAQLPHACEVGVGTQVMLPGVTTPSERSGQPESASEAAPWPHGSPMVGVREELPALRIPPVDNAKRESNGGEPSLSGSIDASILPTQPPQHPLLELRALDENSREAAESNARVKVSCGEMLEIAIPRDILQLQTSGELVFFLTLSLQDGARLRFPNRELFLLQVPELRR